MKKIIALSTALYVAPALAFESFIVKDIRLEGLQRISVGSVFNSLPIKVGEELRQDDTAAAVKALYQTGFFKDVRLEREGDVLVVFVAEAPAISSIDINGNSAIPTEQIKMVLKDLGLTEGRVFERSLFDNIEQELKRQYYSIGKYSIKLDVELKPLERNRIAVTLNIAEGDEALVRQMNVVGVQSFASKDINEFLELADGSEKYSKQVLAGDLEKLRSYYMDRGFINFQIDSNQVSLTPDKKDIYITVNITEGEIYKIREVKLAGELLLPVQEYDALVEIKKDEVFSRSKMTATRQNIIDKLSEKGYPFANVNIIPKLDKDNRTAEMTVFVDPGKRVYVRRINISGNTGTRDVVVRREMRQMESDWLSSNRVSLSKLRLNRTGFFETVEVDTVPVPGSPDQVDLEYKVKERPTGSINFGVGFSDTQGATFNFSIAQDNFLGTGKRVSVGLDKSDVTEQYRLSLRDPYYTIDGVSRTISVFRRQIDAEEADISNYVINTDGASVSYGLPLSEHTSMSLGAGYESSELLTVSGVTAQEITDFVTEHGSDNEVFNLTASWRHDTRNKAIFADRGRLLQFNFESTIPGSDLEFYKIGAEYRQYFPITKSTTLSYNVEIDFGESFGNTSTLPPFENYFAGGTRSVRGYDGNSLGPRDSTGDPLGGNKRFVTNLDLILPNPFSSQENSVRLGLFLDAGNVFGPSESLDLGDLRSAVGIGLIWIAPVGVLRFSLAEPLNDKPGDDTESFQFTLGAPF